MIITEKVLSFTQIICVNCKHFTFSQKKHNFCLFTLNLIINPQIYSNFFFNFKFSSILFLQRLIIKILEIIYCSFLVSFLNFTASFLKNFGGQGDDWSFFSTLPLVIKTKSQNKLKRSI